MFSPFDQNDLPMAMMDIIAQDGRTWIEDMMSPDASQEREGDRRNLTVSLSLSLAMAMSHKARPTPI